jgi:NAD(P)-dependent dehydrogenase (short-subunit alcohol dehydrogenase family)
MADRKTVIITGANGNLGSAVTRAFLDKGYYVIATVAEQAMVKDMPVKENLETIVVDLSKEEDAATFVRNQIQNHGPISGALLLVGGFAMGNIAATPIVEIKKQITLNFETAYHVVRPLFGHMMENASGRIVLIGARPAINPSQGKNLLAYGLSKSLLFKLAEFLNEEAKGKNVVVAVAAPSTLDTELNRKSMPKANPNDWVKPDALAELLEFIVSDKASILRESILKVYNNA